MAFRNSVTIVASPRPRVGKTLLARLLTDFHRHEGRAVAAFDINSGENTLAQFLPEQASHASIADIKGEMALFDRLIAADGVSKVVDVGADSFAAFFAVAAKIGFAEEARGRDVAPAVLFMMTPDHTGIEAYRQLSSRFPAITMTPVHNEILGPAHHRERYLFVGGGAQVVRVPELPSSLRKLIATPPLSLLEAEKLANLRGVPLDSRMELERWLRRVFVDFRQLELRILLANLRSSIKFGSQ
jgi:hypothetical protein